MEFKKYILKNGLRVILVPMQDTQTVTVQILVEAGSKYETKNNNGISHFLEHMVFKGTKNRPTAKKISETLDNFGADYNAFTGKEQTGYWIKAPKNHFDVALNVVSDIYLNPLLKKKDIDTERGVILQEAAMYKDMPMRYIWDIFENLLYGDQPAGWDIIGSENNIKNFQPSDFKNYIDKNYQPKSTVVCIAGNFDKDKALKKIKGLFIRKRNKTKKGKKKVSQQQKTPQLKFFYKKTDQTHLLLGTRSCDMFHTDRYPTVLLGTILGGGMSSRMFTNIREKYGLTYYINAATEQTTDTGYIFASAGVEHKNLEKVVTLILKEFKKIKEGKISQKEIKKAKEYLKGKTLMNLESSSAVTNFFGDQELLKKKVKKPEEIFQKIDQVTENDIKKIAKKIFIDKGLNLAIIGPQENEEKISKILKF